MTNNNKKKECEPRPSEQQLKELEQLSRIFSTDLSNWCHTTTEGMTKGKKK